MPMFQEEYSVISYSGPLSDYTQLLQWAVEKCIPLVREITFQNAEVIFVIS
jgi:hypothetical protein